MTAARSSAAASPRLLDLRLPPLTLLDGERWIRTTRACSGGGRRRISPSWSASERR